MKKRNPITRQNHRFLTSEEISKLTEIMSRGIRNRIKGVKDEEFLTQIGKHIPFLLQFSIEIQIDIFNNAELIKVNSGEYVFEEKDNADSMFIILKGSCDVMAKQPHPTTKNPEYQVIAHICDGNSFGEFAFLSILKKIWKDDNYEEEIYSIKRKLKPYGKKMILRIKKEKSIEKLKKIAMEVRRHKITSTGGITESEEVCSLNNLNLRRRHIKKTKKRTAGMKVVESCILLKISQYYFTSKLIPLIEDDCKTKWRLIAKIPFLRDLEFTQMLVISNLLIKRSFSYGDTLLKVNQKPSSLFIISSGICKVFWRKKVRRKKQLRIPTLGRDKALTAFLYKAFRVEVKEIEDEEAKPFKYAQKSFNTDPVPGVTDPQFEQYYEHYTMKELRKGSIIGLRSVLSKDVTPDGMIISGVDSGIEPAEYSISADSATVEVFEMNKELFQFMPFYIRVGAL